MGDSDVSFNFLWHFCGTPFALHSLTSNQSYEFRALIVPFIMSLYHAFGGASEISTLTWDSMQFNANILILKLCRGSCQFEDDASDDNAAFSNFWHAADETAGHRMQDLCIGGENR